MKNQNEKAVAYHEKKLAECSANCPGIRVHHVKKIAILKNAYGYCQIHGAVMDEFGCPECLT